MRAKGEDPRRGQTKIQAVSGEGVDGGEVSAGSPWASGCPSQVRDPLLWYGWASAGKATSGTFLRLT